MSKEIDKNIIDETLEELGFEEHVSSLSKDKPREFWIRQGLCGEGNDWIFDSKDRSVEMDYPEDHETIHVIEKSAYNELQAKYSKAVEALKNIERDHPKTFLDVGDTLKELGEYLPKI